MMLAFALALTGCIGRPAPEQECRQSADCPQGLRCASDFICFDPRPPIQSDGGVYDDGDASTGSALERAVAAVSHGVSDRRALDRALDSDAAGALARVIGEPDGLEPER
jgi:hypothetical protein